jgi:hypothetical protein
MNNNEEETEENITITSLKDEILSLTYRLNLMENNLSKKVKIRSNVDLEERVHDHHGEEGQCEPGKENYGRFRKEVPVRKE